MVPKQLLCLVLLTSCQVVPVQVARVNLFESYCQSFEFEGGTPEEKNATIAVTLKELLGSANYAALVKREADERLKQLKQGLCQSCGTVNITLSVVPGSILSKTNFKFFVGGQGRFFIMMKKDGRIYYSVDFRLLEEHHDAAELARGIIKIRFEQQLVNDLQQVKTDLEQMKADLRQSVEVLQQVLENPQEEAADTSNQKMMEELTAKIDKDTIPNYVYVNKAIVDVYVKIDTSQAARNIYSVDYDGKHEVRVANKLIGYLSFDKPTNKNDKIMDFKGIRYIRNRY
ncbi:MAG: hypothetical protein AVDCRST_MAG96-3833 [uncultured Segetibacter sp.]|uniref:Uncharacterized protein n=1 Tax=uncultured Segetibacter sp. TaxID=481133 RepID=A0A6J4U0D8_9BACT|nr:MAG: hypothetical protein AVDCRST_MAG96-3833 [uncultured Segetibacter sp.]